MNSVALSEAKEWAEFLLDRESKGRKDREGPIRYRLARKLGVPESYLYRLQYKTDEMSDVKGSVYRALMIARQKYDETCERIENAADAMKRETREIEESNAVDTSPVPSGAGMARPARSPAEQEMR